MADVLPHLNAALNTLTVLLLVAGFALVRLGRRDLHRRVMEAALAVSALFLASYLIYHFSAPTFVFRGEGWIRPVYYAMLISHVILAMLVVPLVVLTVWRALSGRFGPHRGLARWTLPVWLYVSVTGVAVYAMLYHLYPAG